MKENGKFIYDDMDDLPELTDEELEQFKPIEQVMPPEFLAMVFAHQAEMEQKGLMKPRRGKQKAPTKQAVTLRLSPEIIQAFKATGKGWQTRINDVLLKHIQTLA